MKRIIRIVILLLISIAVTFLVCACDTHDITELNLDNIEIDAIDAMNIAVGEYTVPYTIENLNEYVAQYGIIIIITVIDEEYNPIDVSGNTFNVESGKVYSINIKVFNGDTVIKSKDITVTAIVSDTEQLMKLDTPANLQLYSNDSIIFNTVLNATSYELSINGSTVTLNAATYNISALYDTPGEYTIKVRAKADGYTESEYSANLIVSTEIENIALVSSPKTNYVAGDYLDYDRITIEATYGDGRKTILDRAGCLISKPSGIALTTDDTEIDIIHVASDKSVSFAITVIPFDEAIWTVTFNGDGGIRDGGGEEIQSGIPHKGSAIAPQYNKKGYLFLRWNKDFSTVTENITISAEWLDLSVGTTGLDYQSSYNYQYYIVTGYWGSDEYVVIPSTYNNLPVKKIDNSAFYNRTVPHCIYLSESIDSIGMDSFAGCTNLTEFHVSEDNMQFSANDGILFTKTGNALIKCPQNKSGEIVLDGNINTISSNAFANCTNISNIVIPDSVYDIGSQAFYNTAFINSKPEGLVYTGKVAYSYMGTMPVDSVIELEAGTLGIADDAFELQDNLKEIIMSEGLLMIGNYAFNGCDGINDIIIPSSVIKVGVGAFNYCTSLSNIYIFDTLESIGDDAFRQTPWYVNQPDGVVYVGKVAYTIKGEMPESVILEDGTTAIANYAFYLMDGNTTLKNIHIPDSVKTIGAGAFNSCQGLTKLFLPDSVVNIGTYAFINTFLDIYAEAQSEQPGWVYNWNPDPRPVVYNAMSQATLYSFVTNGGDTIDDISAVFLTKFPTTEREGYNFVAWYDNAELSGDPVSLPYYNKSLTTLYADWILKWYFVEFVLPEGWSRTGGGALIQTIVHGSDAASPIVATGEDTFIAWYKDLTNIKENTVIAPVRVKLMTNTEAWARYTMVYAQMVGDCDMEIDYADGKGYIPYSDGSFKHILRNCIIHARASFNGSEVVELPEFVIDNIDSTRPTAPYIEYKHNVNVENELLITLYGGTANGLSPVTHHYRINGGDWQLFSENYKELVAANNVSIEIKTVNEAQTSSQVVFKTIKINKIVYVDSIGQTIERYMINEYEVFPEGESVKYTALKGGYSEVSETYYDYRNYGTGDTYNGCGVKAAEIFVNWFGLGYSQSIVKEYVETTNVAWLDSWIFTTPAQLEDGIADIFDDEEISLALSRRSIETTANAVTWIQNQLAAGYPVIVLANDGDHWQVITEAMVSRDSNGNIEYASFLTHDNGGTEWRSWGAIDYFFENNWSAKTARFIGYSSYRDTLLSIDLG